MKDVVKKIIKAALPEAISKKSATAYNHLRLRRTMNALAGANTYPEFLPASEIGRLMKMYKFVESYGYDPESLKQRGIERGNDLLSLIKDQPAQMNDFLELGCGDGMVSGILQQKGKNCTAIDFFDGGFDNRAANAGVRFLKMDAADMSFAAESFDFVFSYNAFEHFPKPDCVFKEAIRVLRPGGLIYMEFAPLFMSSYGLHAYKSIPIPYCQYLFKETDLDQYTRQNHLPAINFTTHVNRWKIADFRKLWKVHEAEVEKLIYEEYKNYIDLHLIWKYPSCFKSKTDNIDELLIGGIKAIFRKK